jgi:hypothetical protein
MVIQPNRINFGQEVQTLESPYKLKNQTQHAFSNVDLTQTQKQSPAIFDKQMDPKMKATIQTVINNLIEKRQTQNLAYHRYLQNRIEPPISKL